MDLLQLLILLVLAGICGAVAELIIGYKPGNMLVSVIVGVIGAYLGGLLTFRGAIPLLLPVRVGPTTIDIIWTTLGAFVVLLLLALFRGHPTRMGHFQWRPRSERR